MACVNKRTRDVAAQAFKLAFPCGKAECRCAKLCEECQTSFEDAGSWVCEYDTILPHLGKKMTGGRAKAATVLDRTFALMQVQKVYGLDKVKLPGTEDMVSVAADLPLGWLPVPFLFGSDRTFPIVRPASIERMYFWFGEPIPTAQYMGRHDDFAACKQVHDQAQAAVERGLTKLRGVQESDTARFYPYGGWQEPKGHAMKAMTRTLREAASAEGAKRLQQTAGLDFAKAGL